MRQFLRVLLELPLGLFDATQHLLSVVEAERLFRRVALPPGEINGGQNGRKKATSALNSAMPTRIFFAIREPLQQGTVLPKLPIERNRMGHTITRPMQKRGAKAPNRYDN